MDCFGDPSHMHRYRKNIFVFCYLLFISFVLKYTDSQSDPSVPTGHKIQVVVF